MRLELIKISLLNSWKRSHIRTIRPQYPTVLIWSCFCPVSTIVIRTVPISLANNSPSPRKSRVLGLWGISNYSTVYRVRLVDSVPSPNTFVHQRSIGENLIDQSIDELSISYFQFTLFRTLYTVDRCECVRKPRLLNSNHRPCQALDERNVRASFIQQRNVN